LQETDDKQIIDLYRSEATRDRSLELLIGKYQKRLYWHIRKIVISHDDTDDVLQNTFIKLWKALVNFREESALFTWIYRIATNEALGFLRQKQRMATSSIHPIEHLLAKSLESDKYFSGDAIQLKLQQAILSLPEKQRIVFNMRYYDEMPYEQMSQILDTSVGALKASYHIAAKKIENLLVNADHE
jgi:RNA polymerase sigma-70 factor, ECF subfamily